MTDKKSQDIDLQQEGKFKFHRGSALSIFVSDRREDLNHATSRDDTGIERAAFGYSALVSTLERAGRVELIETKRGPDAGGIGGLVKFSTETAANTD